MSDYLLHATGGVVSEVIAAPDAIAEVLAELNRAKVHGGKYASLHEAYAVLAEEVDEVWDIVKQKRSKRSEADLRVELVQVAAVAIKMIGSMDRFVDKNQSYLITDKALEMFCRDLGLRGTYAAQQAWFATNLQTRKYWISLAESALLAEAEAQP